VYFYVTDETPAKVIIDKTMLAFPDYSYKLRTSPDPTWDGYQSLYPSPLEMQRIQNHRLIESLVNQGDKIQKVRQVDHWIYFSSESDREQFANQIKLNGFKIEDKGVADATDSKPFRLKVSRVDPVTVEATDKYIVELWQLAERYNGTYDGWETFLVRE
jgi:regulator of RNase E activity RraB